MNDDWSDQEIDACVRSYLWMRDSEESGYKPVKARVRKALIQGPLSKRSGGSLEFRFQNISSVLERNGEKWISGYKPMANVGASVAEKIGQFASAYQKLRHAHRVNWLVDSIPDEVVRQAAKELASGKGPSYPESTDYDVVIEGARLAPKGIMSHASLAYYHAPLLPKNFTGGDDTHCFNRLRSAGLTIEKKNEYAGVDPEDLEFRVAVDGHKKRKTKAPPEGVEKPKTKDVTSTAYERDPKVVAHVEERANGSCELCLEAAPFNRPNGTPYLEVHHIIPLSERGSDKVENAAALCPNCHRSCHSGSEALVNKTTLLSVVLGKEGKAPN